MIVKVLFLLAYLTVVSCARNSLTFVIDDTASMRDDIKHVKNAAKSIIDIVLNEKSTQIEDIVLVTFNDPEVKFRIQTRNEVELKQAVDSIHVHGGGLCPEPALSGIKRALEESKSGSYLFVFTDASAEDHHRFGEIKTLAQEKQCQIVFVLTGYCSSHSLQSESNRVYHKIAAATNGQVFRIRKNSLQQVLDYVKETIKGDRTVITSAIVRANQYYSTDIHFKIDDQTEYAVVSASGEHVSLEIRDQRDRLMQSLHNIINTENVQVVKLTNVSPGTYTASVKGNIEVNIMVFGRTDFTFEHGFSTTFKSSLANTETQPTIGVNTVLMVSVKNPQTHALRQAVVQYVELLDMKDRVIRKLKTYQWNKDFYYTESFLPPKEMFKIAVSATAGNTGRTIRRIAKTPVTPKKPVKVAPKISKTDNYLKVKEGASIDVPCRISKGNPMPQISWYWQPQGEAGFKLLADQKDQKLQVTNAVTSGYFACVALNIVGRDEQTIQIDVQASPEFENTPAVITKNEGELVTIECKLRKGNPHPKSIVWQFKPRDGAMTQMRNNEEVLRIPSAQFEHAGEYQCSAENTEGRREKVTTLVVQGTPKISKSDDYLKVKEGAPINVYCRIHKGYPRPQISWYWKQKGGAGFQLLTGETDQELRSNNAMTSGYYKCVAQNKFGKDELTVHLDVQASPEFEITPAVITKNEGEPVTIECNLRKGNPLPKVAWQFRPRDGTTSQWRYDGEVLSIRSVQVDQAGKYWCSAENSEGRREKATTLIVQAKPVITIPRSIVTAMENTTSILQCKVVGGFPKPTITWYYKGPDSKDVTIMENDEVVRIANIQLNNAGTYKCFARNTLGSVQGEVEVVVNAPPRIVTKTTAYNGVEGDVVMKLPCAAVGHPTPTITWVVNEQVIDNDKSKEMHVENNTLFLQNPYEGHSTYNNSRKYTCHARNNFGEAALPYEVYITEYPEVGERNKTYVLEKQPYDIHCPLPYTDPESVRWFKFNGSLNVTGPSLHFDNPKQYDSDNYTCRVSDLSEAASHTVEVIFGHPPTRDSGRRLAYKMNWQGESALLDCTTKQFPEGEYTWYYNEEKVTSVHTSSLLVRGWGQYTCNVTNPFGSLEVKINVTSRDCAIPTSLLKTKHIPLVLDASSSWPAVTHTVKYIMVPHSEELHLVCQDNAPHTKTRSSNRFTKLQDKRSIVATCDHEEAFLVDGIQRKFSELDCKDSVAYSIIRTEKTCLGDNTQLMKIGFHVNDFTDVYEACVDTIKNVPLYTKMNTIPQKREDSVRSEVKAGKRTCVEKCCYEKIQLVNYEDVSFGPAEQATFIDSLNSVNYCKPENNTNWHKMEEISRNSKTQYTVWSGAANYQKVGEMWVPKYLWKVLKEVDDPETVAIIYENEQTPGDRLCTGDCGESSVWFEPEGDRTYCCKLDDFKEALGLTIDFDASL